MNAPPSSLAVLMSFARNARVNLALFVLTVGVIIAWHEPWFDGVIYAAGLMPILLAHELGHYFAARRHGVDVTLPYFIPGVPPLYTFGAFIKMKAHRMSRRALLHIGAAGPIAGVVLAVPVYVLGIALSETVALPPMMAPNTAIFFGDSLLSWGVAQVIFGSLPEGTDIVLHPLAHAGWVGLFLTSFNLIPIGQLDGGHVGYALFGKGYARASRYLFWGLVMCGVFLTPAWLVLAIFLLFTGVEHPPIVTDAPLSRRDRVVGYVCFGLFALTFIPQPVVLTSLFELVWDQLAGLS